MKLDRLLELTRNPSLLGADESQDLESLVQEYPYFSAAQLLLTIKYKQQNTSHFNRQLQKAAAHLPDKNVLAIALHEDLARLQLMTITETEAELQTETTFDEPVVIQAGISQVVQAEELEAPDTALEIESVAEVALEPQVVIEEITALEEEVVEAASEIAAVEADLTSFDEDVTLPEVSSLREQAPEEEKENVEVAQVEIKQHEVEKDVKLTGAHTAELNEVVLNEPSMEVETVQTIAATDLPEQSFLAAAHDRLSWFRYFAGKPLHEQPADVLEELYQEHMSGDFLKAEAATLPEIKSELKAVINHDTEVARDKNLEEEIRRLAYESISDEELPASETLAAIYESQRDYKKALRIYQKLMLKFPDRMTYFAGLIASTKEKLNN